MNIFSNVGITELVLILLLAVLVIGPERLPEFSRQLAKLLRDVRKAYENLTRDLGPELAVLQQSTVELRESVEAVRSIPQEMVETVVNAADLEDTLAEFRDVSDSIQQVKQDISQVGKIAQDPVDAAVEATRNAIRPPQDESASPETDTDAPEET